MALFGDKKLVESLQAELARTKEQLAAETAARTTAERLNNAIAQDLTRLKEVVADHEQRLAVLARPRRSSSSGSDAAASLPLALEAEVNEDGNPKIHSAAYTIDGTADQLEALDLVLRIATTAGELGSTVFFDMMVDGDGGGRIVAHRDGQRLRLTEQETNAWLFGADSPQSQRIRDVTRDNGRIIVEIV